MRYLAAFELDRAGRVFRSSEWAAAFLCEYARHLGLDERRTLRRYLQTFGTQRGPQGNSGIPTPVQARTGPTVGRPTRRRRRSAALLALLALSAGVVAAVGAVPGTKSASRALAAPPRDAPEPRRPELPLGGRRLFPEYRVVAYYGSPIGHAVGRVGQEPPALVAQLLNAQAQAYRDGDRPVLPAFEIVATVATSHPGSDGTHTMRVSPDVLAGYARQARAVRGLLIIDIQPGSIPFDREVRRYEHLLRQSDVGVALDPEWRLAPGQIPGEKVGSVDAAEVNRVIEYLAGLVRAHDLPQKLLVIHQFTWSMVTNRQDIHRWPEVAVAFDFDGVGSRLAKAASYAELGRSLGGAARGIKLYHDHDVGLMTPRQVLRLDPAPDLVVYQ